MKCWKLSTLKSLMVLLIAGALFSVWLNTPTNLRDYPKFMQSLLYTENYPYQGKWINPEGNFFERVQKFSKELGKLRDDIILKRNNTSWKAPVNLSDIIIIDPNSLHFMQNLTSTENVHVMFLQWKHSVSVLKKNQWTSLTDKSNLVIHKYYHWVADQKLCDFVTDKAFVNLRWAYWPSCKTGYDELLPPASLDSTMLNPRLWVTELEKEDNNYVSSAAKETPPFITYLTVIQNAVISEKGSVVSGNVKIFPSSCQRKEWKLLPDKYQQSPLYAEVLTIAQRWGMMYYHGNIESLPRVTFYLDFLKRNPSVKVHCGEMHSDFGIQMLAILGIPKERIIKGVIRAKIVYLTEGTTCGYIQVPSIQLMAQMYIKHIYTLSVRKRNVVLLIKRTKSRGFKQNELIENLIRNATVKCNLKFQIFNDDPAPSLEEAMLLFNSAVMVIAPHGAGLFNIIFCEPGTYVIEAVQSIPHVTMCFQRLAYGLGLRYYGAVGTGFQEIDIDVKTFLNVIEYYMPYAAFLH